MVTFAAGLRTPFAAAVIAAALLTGCGAGSSPAATQISATKTEPQPASRPSASSVTSTPASPAQRAADRPAGGARRGRPAADPRLPQHALGRVPRRDAGRVAGRDHRERPAGASAFFPLAAYQKLKAIYDPAADWDNRLWYDFTLDVRAAHQIVDPDAP